MDLLPIASNSSTSIIIFGAMAALFIGALHALNHRHDPFRKLAQFRVKSAAGVRFTRLAYATVGDTPTHCSSYYNTLSVAVDSDYVWLRHSRIIPFFPSFWRLPRNQVRRFNDKFWTVRIHSAEPPLNADLGAEFLTALSQWRDR